MTTNCNETENSAVKTINEHCSIRLTDQRKLLDPVKCERAERFYIEFENLCYSVRQGKGKRKKILHDISGCFRPGKLTVIVGPSGAGKTSLLSIVCGLRLSNVKGSITINGFERNLDTFRRHTCYIPQEFALMPLLTTRETLYIAARLKLEKQASRTSQLVVNEIAEGLGLTDCLDTLAGNLSGGERKRLSIGVEIITKPSIMLLDEPTSGLDSTASNQVINLLHTMAQAGCTVACAVHQPSSQMISQFDDIIVLNQGRTFYCGPREEMLGAFTVAGYACPQFYNIAEFVLEVVTEQRGGDLENLYRSNAEKYVKWKSQNEYLRSGTDPTLSSEYLGETGKSEFGKKPYTHSCWKQQKVLFLRAILCIKRDNTLTKLRFAAHIIIALLLGAVFYDFGNNAQRVPSNIACLFFFLLFLYFANSMPAVQMFPVEAAVFLREHLNNWYYLRSYYIVKVISDLPMQIICPSCFLIISYYLTGQPMECDRMFKTWVICLLLAILGQTVGIVTGAVFNTELGMFIVPALSIPLLLFAGFFLKLGEMSVYLQPLGTISFFRYAFEGIMQAIYDGDRPKLSCPDYCYVRLPKDVLAMMDMPSIPFSMVIIIIVTWIAVLHALLYALLRWRLRGAKT